MRQTLLIFTLIVLSTNANSQTLDVHIVDVGAGLCAIIEIPNEQDSNDPFFFIYDADKGCKDAALEIISPSEEIDFMVLSHNDADHIEDADDIYKTFKTKQLIWSGLDTNTNKFRDVDSTATKYIDQVINLKTDSLAFGSHWMIGDAKITFVSGYHVPPSSWGFTPSNTSLYRNSGSIVIRLSFGQSSVLFTGDMVGRLDEVSTFPDSGVAAHEKEVIDRATSIPIESNVLIASHHGGNDASSVPFIKEVNPEYVIFSAGSHDTYAHPNKHTAKRFLDFGIPLNKILRTDRGDDESKDDHWEPDSNIAKDDPERDDDILIKLNKTEVVTVKYKI